MRGARVIDCFVGMAGVSRIISAPVLQTKTVTGGEIVFTTSRERMHWQPIRSDTVSAGFVRADRNMLKAY